MKRMIYFAGIAFLSLAGCFHEKGCNFPPHLSIHPVRDSLAVAETLRFTADWYVSETDRAKGPTWYVNNVVGGDATHGTITDEGLYTAPWRVPFPDSVTIAAIIDTLRAEAKVRILPPPILIYPPEATLNTGDTLRFTASETSVIWTVNGYTGPGSSGMIDSSGLFTAPLRAPLQGSVDVEVNQFAGVRHGKATVTVIGDPNIRVVLSPHSDTLYQSDSLRFTVTVSGTVDTAILWQVHRISGGGFWFPGWVTESGVYYPPPPEFLDSPMDVWVIALSCANPVAKDSAFVHVLLGSGR